MAASPSLTEPQAQQKDNGLVALGGWLFARRTSIPFPIVLALLLVPSSPPGWRLAIGGGAVIAAGEGLRLWGVRQIGAVSRTRSERLGPLISAGPFAYVRNPLYIGNLALWIGFSLCAGLPWLAPVILLALGFVYHAIVRWEEQLLVHRLGAGYLDYTSRVPRWLPRYSPASRPISSARFAWRDTLFSERGTLLAIVAGFVLLALKFAV
jgi:protein-S-isoprenylcysteine O-methyltransferase Ste14